MPSTTCSKGSAIFAAGLLIALSGCMEPVAEPADKTDAKEPETTARVTTVRITDEVIVPNVMPFGINHSTNDTYFNLQVRNQIIEENFEGTLYRQTLKFQPSGEPDSIVVRRETRSPEKLSAYDGGNFVIISGVDKGTSGKIESVTQSPEDEGEWIMKLDAPISGQPGAVLVEKLKPEEATLRKPGGVRLGDGAEYAHGESDPDSFGANAVKLSSAKDDSVVRLFAGAQSRIDNNGDWKIRLRHKASSGSPELRIHSEGRGEETSVPSGPEWQTFETVLRVESMPDEFSDMGYLRFLLEPRDGEVLVDDIEVIRTGDQNPTKFRDEAIAAFKDAGFGLVRALHGSHNTLRNAIMPEIKSYASFDNPGSPGSLHEFYEFCEQVGATPYYCLPATLTTEEMERFMEYIGAPAEVGWGQLRAELGHPEPWTQTLPGIIVEFGNELYNFGGFGGPDYWHDLIETAKASPYYDPKVFFTMGSQGDALDYAQNMDGYSMGGYDAWGFTKDDYEKYIRSDEELFDWASAVHLDAVRKDGPDAEKANRAIELGIEPAMYEGSWHINFGDGPNEPRNKLVTSVGGAVIYINQMLVKLRDFGIRKQGYFATIGRGHQFKGTGAFGSEEAGYVRMWGSILKLEENESVFRPAWHALKAVNTALNGNMVRTEQFGDDPRFTVTGTFPTLRQIKRGEKVEAKTVKDLPRIFSYAFENGDQHSLILVNLDPASAHPVEVKFDSKPKGPADLTLLAGEHFTDHNELDWNDSTPVELKKSTLEDFRSGSRLELPPLSLQVIEWTSQAGN